MLGVGWPVSLDPAELPTWLSVSAAAVVIAVILIGVIEGFLGLRRRPPAREVAEEPRKAA